MQGLFPQAPVARAVAIFTALNLLTVLLFTLVVPARPINPPLTVPILVPQEALWRVGLALTAYALVLWGLRPGKRRLGEFTLLGLAAAGAVLLLTRYYLPFLALGLVPVVARYWLPLWSVLWLVAGLVGFSGWWSLRHPLQISLEMNFSQGPGNSVLWSALQVPVDYPNIETSFLVLITFLFAGYSLFALEVLVREARARQELESTRCELELASRQAGMLEERQRLAREIHDTLAQGFASIVVNLEAAEISLPLDAPASPHLQQARSSAREGLSEARRLVWALRPEILEQFSLPGALRNVIQKLSQETGLEAKLSTTGEAGVLHPEIEITLLRVAQEALTNARKHAKASKVELTLSYLGDRVLLDINDDGVGFVVSGTGGFGLRSMRERVEAFGGQLSVESEPGQGTTVAANLPAFPMAKEPEPTPKKTWREPGFRRGEGLSGKEI